MSKPGVLAGAVLGAVIGLATPLAMYGSKPSLAVLVIAGLVLLLPTFFLKDAKPYWLAVFLFSLQFDIKKNLVDGLSVIETLNIDYTQLVFTPELRLSDLALGVLLIRWAHEIYVRKRPLRIPGAAWAAGAFLAWATLAALLKAPHYYLAGLEILRQCKFLVIYLYAANNLDSKRLARLAFVVLMTTLIVQGVVTAARYEFRYFEPIENLLGVKNQEDASHRLERLSIDTQEEQGFGYTEARRSFGTLQSPAATGKYCLLIAPIALLFLVRRGAVAPRAMAATSLVLGTLTVYLTFSRASMVGYLGEMGLGYLYALRRRYLPPSMGVIGIGIALCLGGAVTPTLYAFMENRREAVTVRFEQYDAATSMILKNPVLGVGINNSAGVQKDYTEASYFVADSLRQSMTQPIHSYYLTLLAETGIPGFVLYMAFFLVTVDAARRLSRTARDPQIALFASIIVVALAGLAAGVIVDPLFEDGVQTIVWLYAGMIVALCRLDADGVTAPVPIAAHRFRAAEVPA